MRQYEVGEQFVRGVVDRGGTRRHRPARGVSPENLPTLAELDDAGVWLARVDRLPVAS